MSEVLKQFMAALHHADWTQQGVTIAGSEFTHNEVRVIVKELENETRFTRN